MEHEDHTPVTSVTVDYHSIIHNGSVAFQMIAKTKATYKQNMRIVHQLVIHRLPLIITVLFILVMW